MPSTRFKSTRRDALALAGAAGLALAMPARAQGTYPNRPIRMIVPLAAASAVDVAARLIAQKMSANMGQTIVVENIVGAAGIIGASQLAKAPPDGYTIGGFNDSILTMVPNLNPATPFNPLGDFAHISQVATIDFSISTASTAPYKSAADFVAAAKAAPGKLTYASGGNGSPQHMAGALFAAHTGIDIRHVPYRGASQAAQDVASGQCDVTLQGIATVAALAKAGRLRLIGVMADQRHPEFPDAPTLKEVGITGFEFSTWFALIAPKGTPREIVERLQRESVKALGDAEIKERYAALGLRAAGTTPERMMAIVQEQLTRYGKAIRDNNIKGD
jgi:tripartite-type tricarboxylate transporter receptor subunit TctC